VPDPYATLEVDRNATDDVIRRQYLALTRQYPPEQNPERFAAVRTAYDAIKDLDARVKYKLFHIGDDDSIDKLIEDLECRTPRRRPTLAQLLNSLPKPGR